MAGHQIICLQGITVSLSHLNRLKCYNVLKSSADRTSSLSLRADNSLLIVQSLSYYGARIIPTIIMIVLQLTSSITGLIGLAYPLFNSFLPIYLKERVSNDAGVGETYRNYTIISVLGIPGSLIACLVVDWTRGSDSRWSLGGRKLTMAVSTALTGIFLFLFTTSKTEAAVLGFSCASGLTQYVLFILDSIA